MRRAALSVAFALVAVFALSAGAGDHATTGTLMPASATARTIPPVWTPAEALATYDAYQITANTGALMKFGQDWQLEAYRTRAQMAQSARAASVALSTWAGQIDAGRWAPALRPLVDAAAAEGRQMSEFYARYSTLPTKAAMDRYMRTHRHLGWTATRAFRDALRSAAA